MIFSILSPDQGLITPNSDIMLQIVSATPGTENTFLPYHIKPLKKRRLMFTAKKSALVGGGSEHE
jgi:hypothetical protein